MYDLTTSRLSSQAAEQDSKWRRSFFNLKTIYEELRHFFGKLEKRHCHNSGDKNQIVSGA